MRRTSAALLRLGVRVAAAQQRASRLAPALAATRSLASAAAGPTDAFPGLDTRFTGAVYPESERAREVRARSARRSAKAPSLHRLRKVAMQLRGPRTHTAAAGAARGTGAAAARLDGRARAQNMFFTKQDELALRKLLTKVKAQADVTPQPAAEQQAQQAQPAKAAPQRRAPAMRGGYGGDTASAAQAEGGAAAVAAPQPEAERAAALEREALRRILQGREVSDADVEALLAWRHSHEF